MVNFYMGSPIHPKALVIIGAQDKLDVNHILSPQVYGSVGYRLWRLMQRGNKIDRQPDLFSRTDFVWCCHTFTLCGDEYNEDVARERAAEFRLKEKRPVLLLGSRVLRAFFGDAFRGNPLPWQCGSTFVISNPAGNNRAYEEIRHYRACAETASTALSYAMRLAAENRGTLFAPDQDADQA